MLVLSYSEKIPAYISGAPEDRHEDGIWESGMPGCFVAGVWGNHWHM
jgi:hypothetical protein